MKKRVPVMQAHFHFDLQTRRFLIGMLMSVARKYHNLIRSLPDALDSSLQYIACIWNPRKSASILSIGAGCISTRFAR